MRQYFLLKKIAKNAFIRFYRFRFRFSFCPVLRVHRVTTAAGDPRWDPHVRAGPRLIQSGNAWAEERRRRRWRRRFCRPTYRPRGNRLLRGWGYRWPRLSGLFGQNLVGLSANRGGWRGVRSVLAGLSSCLLAGVLPSALRWSSAARSAGGRRLKASLRRYTVIKTGCRPRTRTNPPKKPFSGLTYSHKRCQKSNFFLILFLFNYIWYNLGLQRPFLFSSM